jgi:uncharacterized OsmC-like protein
MTPNTKVRERNGVNVERLFQTIEAVKATPSLGSFKFRLRNRWEDCGENRSTIKDFYGCGAELQHKREFTLVADEPDILLGADQGANATEYLLHALAACVTGTMVYHAAARGITIDEVESSLEGDLDLRGFLGIDPQVRNGYQQIRMKFRIKSDATDEQLQELAAFGPRFSPVFDSITKGVPVEVSTERKR